VGLDASNKDNYKYALHGCKVCVTAFNKERLDNAIWRSNEKGHMSNSLFVENMQAFDELLQRQNRDAVVLLDNANYHQRIALQRVKFMFLPTKSTSSTQLLDLGIIDSFKTMYQERLLQELFVRAESNVVNVDALLKRFDLKEAVDLMCESWLAVSSQRICECFEKAGIGSIVDLEEMDNQPMLQLLHDDEASNAQASSH